MSFLSEENTLLFMVTLNKGGRFVVCGNLPGNRRISRHGFPSLQQYTRVYRDIYRDLHRYIQGFTGVYNGLQRVCKGIKGFTGIYKSIRVFTRVRRVIQGFTGVY